ncbi:hypothetical protein T4E_5293 [Trichinella pseudospiralis]|uniref:Uncharacterized protein n=1 Tax=Trichinella pseudospiralis TaxID=6337 RepID=A0A0V0XGM3_TRIPS|nr:hypothetical protein T4E_11377 [Trichinella pseudospiralis]KRX87080.1 hypothetical protein T4E_5293 [Trichinella pseudospiralis]
MVCWPRRTDGNDQRRCDSGDLFCSNGADLSICHASHSRCRSTNDHGLQAIFQTERRSAVRICAVNAWKCKRNPTNDDWLAPSLNVVANYSCFATSIPKSMLLGGHPLNDWSMKFNDQVHRLSKLQKNMVHLSRRIGPRQHGLLIDLVNLHDRLRSLTSHFQKNLLHFRRDLSPLIETEKNILKSTVPHATNKNTIDNTSFHASTSYKLL